MLVILVQYGPAAAAVNLHVLQEALALNKLHLRLLVFVVVKSSANLTAPPSA